MKYPKEQFEKILKYLPLMLKAYGGSSQIEEYTDSLLSKLHFQLFLELTYSSDNLNVSNTKGQSLVKNGGERLFEIDKSFELYPNDCNDTNVLTAMKKAIKIVVS